MFRWSHCRGSTSKKSLKPAYQHFPRAPSRLRNIEMMTIGLHSGSEVAQDSTRPFAWVFCWQAHRAGEYVFISADVGGPPDAENETFVLEIVLLFLFLSFKLKVHQGQSCNSKKEEYGRSQWVFMSSVLGLRGVKGSSEVFGDAE